MERNVVNGNLVIFCITRTSLGFLFGVLLSSCTNYFKNDYKDNSPTSGQLNVYYDEGLQKHITNHVYTFEALYPDVQIKLFSCNDDEAVEALFNDSCEAIVISRELNEREKKNFAAHGYYPKFSAVAMSGIALLVNTETALRNISVEQLKKVLSGNSRIQDSLGNEIEVNILLDKNRSSVMQYIRENLLGGKKLSDNCSALESSTEAINYVAQKKNTIAIIDFAWLSDMDDSLYKANANKLVFLAVCNSNSEPAEQPSQSSFKLKTYPLTRTIYVYRKTGDFTIAKGFESFVAGPKGQNTFLKQGLLPTKQQERSVKINFEALQTH